MNFAILLVIFAITLRQGVTGVPLNDPNDIESQKANARNVDKLLEDTYNSLVESQLLSLHLYFPASTNFNSSHSRENIIVNLYKRTFAKFKELFNGIKGYINQTLLNYSKYKIPKDQPVSPNIYSDDITQANPTVSTLDESTVNQEFTQGIYVSTNDNKNEKSEDNKNTLTSESTESSDKTKENVTQNPVTNAAPDEI